MRYPRDYIEANREQFQSSNSDPEMSDREKAEFVLGVYFRTQAAIEKYMGRENLPVWTEHVAKINAQSTKKGPHGQVDRAMSLLGSLVKMLGVYGSDVATYTADETFGLVVHRCGIWEYRVEAQKQGVELTLPTPCEFCVDLHRRTARHLRVSLEHELGERSCHWEATSEVVTSAGGAGGHDGE